MQWHTLAIPAVGRWRQEYQKSKSSFCYRVQPELPDRLFKKIKMITKFVKYNSWVWWLVPIILVLERLRQKDSCEFQASRDYRVKHCLKTHTSCLCLFLFLPVSYLCVSRSVSVSLSHTHNLRYKNKPQLPTGCYKSNLHITSCLCSNGTYRPKSKCIWQDKWKKAGHGGTSL